MPEKKFILNPRLYERLNKIIGYIPDLFLFVNIQLQKLFYIKNQYISAIYSVSTSKYGTGNLEGSFKTPLGIHRVAEKIGAEAPWGRIFRDRKDTGENWHNEMNEENMILSRIMRLEGLEDGINRGPNIDSFDRYIYIHGTNREEQIGTPISHGCICMKHNDIIKLFDIVTEDTIVIID